MRLILCGVALASVLAVVRPLAVAQNLPAPTIDERYRDEDAKKNAEAPALNAPQSRLSKEKKEEPVARTGPAYFGAKFRTGERGAVIGSVQPGSPADQAGLQPGDDIEALQGKTVRSYQDAIDLIERMRPGEVVDIKYSRRMSLRTQAALASSPSEVSRSANYPPEQPRPEPRAERRSYWQDEGRSDTRSRYDLRDSIRTDYESDRDAVSGSRSKATSDQRRGANQNKSDEPDSGRRWFRLFRRR
jgi:hypothetical protein